ncbi:lysozyme [uncultured Sphingomonas sp.]|uniref:lysozyme n=1 Tax=uncultured Sphingomonas sp. TaxID=158754 RepID=UPI0025E9AA38|nr:lysozyme [uncultured Sphingomonas sp.]
MTDRKVGPKALALMHHFEDCELVAYADPGTGGDPYTIGWGMTYYPDGRKVKRGDQITRAQADADFATILDRDFARIVDAAIGNAPTTSAQFGAMVALAYNIGVGPRMWLPGMKKGFRQSWVLKMHIAGRHAEAAGAFGSWITAGGKVKAGLVRRRNAEAALYAGDRAALARFTNGALA